MMLDEQSQYVKTVSLKKEQIISYEEFPFTLPIIK